MDSDNEINEDLIELRIDESKIDEGEHGHKDSLDKSSFADCDTLGTKDKLSFADDKSSVAHSKFCFADQKLVFANDKLGYEKVNLVSETKLPAVSTDGKPGSINQTSISADDNVDNRNNILGLADSLKYGTKLGSADDKLIISDGKFHIANKKSDDSADDKLDLIKEKLHSGNNKPVSADDKLETTHHTLDSANFKLGFENDKLGSRSEIKLGFTNQRAVLADDKVDTTDQLVYSGYNLNSKNKRFGLFGSESCKNITDVIWQNSNSKRNSCSTERENICGFSDLRRNTRDTKVNSVYTNNMSEFLERRPGAINGDSDFSANCSDLVVKNDSGNKQSRINGIENNLQTIKNARERLILKSKAMENDLNAYIDSFIEATNKHRNRLLSQLREMVLKRGEKLNEFEELIKRGVSNDLIFNMSDTGMCGEIVTGDTLKFDPEIPSAVIGGYQMFGVITDSSLVHDKCFLAGGSECAVVDKEVMVQLHGTDGINPENIQSWVKRQTSKRTSNFTGVRLKKSKENQYSLSYIPRHVGLHHLYVQVDGIPVQGSPTAINVLKPNKRRKTEQKNLDINVQHRYNVNDSGFRDTYYDGKRWSAHNCIIPETSVNNNNKRKLQQVTV